MSEQFYKGLTPEHPLLPPRLTYTNHNTMRKSNNMSIKTAIVSDEGELLDEIIGTSVLIRCVTHYWVGRVVAIDPTTIKLDDAAWIGSTGRFADALANGTLDEVEPAPDGPVYVMRGAGVDICPWRHPLPRDQK